MNQNELKAALGQAHRLVGQYLGLENDGTPEQRHDLFVATKGAIHDIVGGLRCQCATCAAARG